jgi:hypothetical protein
MAKRMEIWNFGAPRRPVEPSHCRKLVNEHSLPNSELAVSTVVVIYYSSFKSMKKYRVSVLCHDRRSVGQSVFIIARHLRLCWCGALSLTRGWVCRLQLLLAFASAVIFGSESLGTHDHILISQIRDFSLHRLIRFAGLRWRYSTPPPRGSEMLASRSQLLNNLGRG